MNPSRRTFLIGSSLAALPLLGLPVRFAQTGQHFAIGEIWGMPFAARGAESAALPIRKRRASIHEQGWHIEFA